ncbi:MAG: hypothetical protein RBR59_04810, partial [Sulfurimonadaceae bacterium]|nr:hypothetical protein [Sulfurimonadaceae bacterium]
MKRFYTFFQASTILSLLVAYAIVLIFFHKDVLPFLADTYLHEYGISYESIEGTLFSGGKIKNLKYNGLHAKEVEIKYNFLKLLRPTPRINSIHAKGVQIDLDSFLSQEVSTTSQAINISKIKIDDSTLVHQKKKYKFNLQASYFTMRETIDIEKFNISLESFYANLKAEGKIVRNHLHAKGFTTLSKDIEDEYLDFLSFVPKNIPFLVDIDSKMLSLQISLDTLSLKEREELKLHAIKAELFYNFTDTTFEVLSDYNLEYQEYGIKIVQKSFFDTHGTIWSGLDAVIKNAPFSLPFESFSMDMRKDTNLTNIQFKADGFTIAAESPDLKEFHFDYEMFYAKGKANLTLSEDENYLEAKFILLKTFPFFDTLKLHENKPITVALHQKEDRFTASAFMGEDTITAFYYNQLLHGFINFKAADIWFNSDVETKYLYAHTVIPSLKDTLTKFQQENLDIDAKVEIESVVNFKKSLKIQSTLTLPWFSIDMKKSGFFSGTDAHFDFVYKENELQLKEYQFSVMNHFFYSKKPSKVLLKPNGDIELSEFWIYDSLQAKGYLRTVDGSGYLKLTSDSFTYIRDDANLTLKGTIEAKLDADTKQTITGEIVLTGGEISYQLQKDYAISDEDIVILQDFVFEKDGKEKTNRYVHIEIKSEKDVDY